MEPTDRLSGPLEKAPASSSSVSHVDAHDIAGRDDQALITTVVAMIVVAHCGECWRLQRLRQLVKVDR
jgi:hypothetical protein